MMSRKVFTNGIPINQKGFYLYFSCSSEEKSMTISYDQDSRLLNMSD